MAIGGSNAEGISGPDVSSGFSDAPESGGSSNLLAALGKLIKSPAGIKAIGDATSALGKSLVTSQQGDQKHTAAMMKHATGGVGGGGVSGGAGARQSSNSASAGPSDPQGQQAFALQPQQAAEILRALGIPSGFNPLP